MNFVKFSFFVVLAGFGCGDGTVIQNNPDLNGEDMTRDLSQKMDMFADDMYPDMFVEQDMNLVEDIGKDLAVDVDMGQDMTPDMFMDMGKDMMSAMAYEGQSCTDGNETGVCLDANATCDSRLVGACAGGVFTCCVRGCQANGQNGQCSEVSQCGETSTPGLCPGPSNVQCCTKTPTGQGQPVGTLWNTYYYLAQEKDYSGSANTALNDSSCNQLLKVPSAFSDAVCIEGSGQLKDGRVINYATTCNCGRPCPTGGIVCYSILDKTRFPWGKGNRNNPLVPLRSLAVDRSKFANGTILYLKEFDGVMMPSVDGLGGFKHDGCFRADDVGGGIKDLHIDIFAGTPNMRLELEKIFPTRTDFEAYKDTPKCLYLK